MTREPVRHRFHPGYEVDEVVTDAVVKLNEVTDEVTVHEALTGTQLAATTIVARDDACPMSASFTQWLDFAFHDSLHDSLHDSFHDEAEMDLNAPAVTL